MDPLTTISGNPLESKLPAEIAAALEPQEQSALDHRVRRDILRQLLARSPQSPNELTLALSSAALSVVQYHLSVLTNIGAVTIDGTREAKGSRQSVYAPAFADEDRILGVLGKMEKQDSAAPRRFKTTKSPLGPRRLISIRLGKRHRKSS
jgi:DNA-binding transcriptional ArsR family regulator